MVELHGECSHAPSSRLAGVLVHHGTAAHSVPADTCTVLVMGGRPERVHVWCVVRDV